jgi:LuxR family maltose regulon positive regulatory protein
MEQPEQKSREQILKELADLRRQLSDLEQQVVNVDRNSDLSAGGQSATPPSYLTSARLQDVLEATSEAAIAVDSNGHIVMANERIKAVFGYDARDLIDQPVELLIPDRFRDQHIEHRHTFIAEPRVRPMGERLSLVGRQNDGSEIPVRIGFSFTKNEDEVITIVQITKAIAQEEPGVHPETSYPTLITVKARRPKISSEIVPRPHLTERLNLGLDRTHIVVVAPAGYGKSTLVSSWLAKSDYPSAWLTLDEADNDLGSFLSAFIVALGQVLPDACQSTKDILQRASLPAPSVLLASLINELGQALIPSVEKRKLVVALDDYHTIRNRDIHKLLTALLQSSPPGFHLVILSRRDPPIGLSKLRAQSLVAEFRLEDLRFQSNEIRVLMERLLNQSLTPATLKILERKTEGWVTGLRLAALAAKTPEDLDRVFNHLKPYGSNIMDYLFDEVLQRQPADVQQFLLNTSVLDRFTPSLAGKLMEVEQAGADARRQQDIIQRANLFVISLSDDGEWYRYHHLFQELLRHRLEATTTPERIAALHIEASKWLAQNGYVDEALQHALIGEDADGAAQLIEAQRLPALNQEQWHRLQRWTNRMPRYVVNKRPILLLTQAWLMSTQFRMLEIEPILLKVESLLREQELGLPSGVAKMLEGEIAILRSQAAYFQGNGQLCLELADSALLNLPLRHSYGRGFAYLFRCGGQQISGDLEGAYTVAREALAEDSLHGNVFISRPLQALLVLDYISLDFKALEQSCDRFLKAVAERTLSESQGWPHTYRGWLHYWRNELELANFEFQEVVDQRYRIHNRAAVSGYCGLALTHQASGRFTEAQATIEAALAYDLELGVTGTRAIVESVKAQVALMQGNLDVAGRWAASFDRKLMLPFMINYVAPHLMLPRILLAQGTKESLDEAAELMPQLRRFAKRICNSLDVVELLALEALLDDTNNQQETAYKKLEKSLALAQPAGIVRIFSDLGPQMGRLLHKLAGQHSLAPDLRNFCGLVLDALGDTEQRRSHFLDPTLEKQDGYLETLTSRELEVLRLLGDRLTNREIGIQLGISHLTVKRHTINIYQKLDVGGRQEAVTKAQNIGLLPPA